MSQKAICPRGHIWDPSTLAGLPPTDTPRCPICGEEEPLRASNALTRLNRWLRNNPALAGLSALCLLLCAVLAVSMLQARSAMRAAHEEAEQAQFKARQAEAKLRSPVRAAEAEDKEQLRKRRAEMEAKKWRNREEQFQKQLFEAKKTALLVRQQRDDEITKRRVVEDLKQTSDQEREDALSRRAEASRKLVKMHVAAGTRLMESGDLSASLPWFVEALRLAEKEKLPVQTHRLRLAAVLSQCPRPVRMWIHDKKINVVQLSPDGKRVLTTRANAVEVWDTSNDKRLGEPLAHMEAVTHAVFSPDGKLVLRAAADMTLHLWDVDKGQEVLAAQQLQGPVVGLAFSPDGKRFLVVTDKAAMGAAEVELHVRDAASGEAIREAALGSEISPLPAVFSPDGQRILTVCQDRCARVWEIATGKQIGPAFSHAAAVITASFSPDGERVLTASSDGTARVWKAKTGEPVTPFLKHGAAMRGACFSPSGPYVLTFGADRGVRVWDASKGDMVGAALRHDETVSDAVFSPDGRFVLTTCADGAARLWDYQTGEAVVPALWHGEPIRYAAFAPAGDSVLTLAGQVVRLWDLTAGEPTRPPTARSEPGLLTVFSPDGKRVLRVTETAVRVYDTKTNEPVGGTLPHKNKVSAAAFSADGKRVLTVSHQPNGDELEGHVRVWETATGQLLGQPLIHPRSVLEASFSPDGRRVLTACQDGKARLWDVEKSVLVGEPMEQKTDVSRARFVSDGKHLLTVDVEGGLRLWDADKAEAVGPIWGHQKPVHHLAFSADGQKLVTASADGTAGVWEASTGHEIARTAMQGAPVVWAAFRPDGKRIVTVSDDQRARVWDAGNGKAITPSLRHHAAIARADFSRDGKRIVTLAADGLRVWDAASGEPIGPVVKHHSDPTRDQGNAATLAFPADERPAADLLRVAEVLSAQRAADAGEMAPLDRAELSKAWLNVRKKYEKDFTASRDRVAAWHRRGAEECERRQLWSGALRHLDYLIIAGPSPDLHARRGRANSEMQGWQAAKADYTKALAKDGDRWDSWAGRAKAEAALGRWQEAAADYSKAIERKADRAELWTARGRIEAEHGDWRKAVADLGKAIHLGEQDVTVWRQHILALLASGDEANYRRWCGRLVEHFGDRKDEAVIQSVVWTCALSEGAVRDWKALVRRAEQAATTNPHSADNLRQLAVLWYRAGQFDAALKRAQEATTVSRAKPQARDWLVMAMAAQRLGRGQEAKKSLDKAEQIRRDRAKDDHESWEERLTYQTLRREAETLMK
ncbi:MAG: beta-propeller domain-containing protein, partial [Gemmataceae bacterium]